MTTSPICRWLWIALGALLITATLAAACSSNGAVDVTPAKPDEDLTETAEPETDDPPWESQPSDEAGSEEPDAPADSNGWIRLSPSADLLHIETAPGGQAIVAGGQGGGLLSIDGGATWRRLDWPGELRSAAYVDPSGQVVMVAGFSSASGMETAAFRSEDAGVSWGPVLFDTPALAWFVVDSFLHGVPGRGVYASNDALETSTLLAQATAAWPENFDPVLITTNSADLDVFAVTSLSEAGSASVRLTWDSGRSFAQLAAEFELWGVTVPVFSAIGPMIMSQGVGVLLSFDQGETWFTQNDGLEQLQSDGLYVGLVDLVSPPQRSLPVVASRGSIFTFSPSGWQEVAGPGAEIRALAVLRAVPGGTGELLLAATDQGVWSIPTAVLGRTEP